MPSSTPTYFTPGDLDGACAWLAEGGVLVFPTETFYGLAADPRARDAVERVMSLKGRRPGHPLPLLAGDRRQVALAAPGWEDVEASAELADRFWPGPLTLVLDGAPGLARGAAGEDGSIAIRVSAHPMAAALARKFGFPVTSTSANRTGAAPPVDARHAVDGLPRSRHLAVLDGGLVAGGMPSTIVDTRTTPLRVVRAGAIDPSGLA